MLVYDSDTCRGYEGGIYPEPQEDYRYRFHIRWGWLVVVTGSVAVGLGEPTISFLRRRTGDTVTA